MGERASFLHWIKRYFGWRSWAVLQYNSVFENLFVIFYLFLANGRQGLTDIFQILLFAVFSIFSTTYGYLINDLGDRELDTRHGKPNTFTGDSNTQALLVVVLVFMLHLISGIFFIRYRWFTELWVSWFFVTTAYSLQPIRLKERGPAGLFSVVLAQRLLPLLMLLVVFGPADRFDGILLALYVFLRGLSSDLNHQVEDFKHDLQTDTRTFAVKTGKEFSAHLLRWVLELEKLLLLGVLILGGIRFYQPGFTPYLLFIVATLLYLVLYTGSLIKIARNPVTTDVNPFRPGIRNLFQVLHHSFPSVMLAVTLNAMLVFKNYWFAILLLLQFWLRGFFNPVIYRNSYILGLFTRKQQS